MSVPHTPIRCTRTSASPAFSEGLFSHVVSERCPGSSSRIAFMSVVLGATRRPCEIVHRFKNFHHTREQLLIEWLFDFTNVLQDSLWIRAADNVCGNVRISH